MPNVEEPRVDECLSCGFTTAVTSFELNREFPRTGTFEADLCFVCANTPIGTSCHYPSQYEGENHTLRTIGYATNLILEEIRSARFGPPLNCGYCAFSNRDAQRFSDHVMTHTAELLSANELQALEQAMKFLNEQNGQSHQGYFSSGGWVGSTIDKLITRSQKVADESVPE